ncbi:MAG: Betaine-aldehyde dehydrogenase [Acidimicrobiales bacterium]|nr:Betaine-aldehyde dehydrogenase [Acidimicrobiales bacterium]
MADRTMTIDGEAVGSEDRFGVINPATGKVFEHAPECSSAQLDAAMASSAKAFGGWRRDEQARRDALLAAAALIDGNTESLTATLTAEQGKPLAAAREEVGNVARTFRYFAGLPIEAVTIQDDAQALVTMVRRPLGVVAAITPWNFPLVLAAYKIGAALVAGNTMVLKPSPYTPLATLSMGEVLREAFPPGVLNVVSGGNELGGWMTAHETPAKITFTGSVATGKKVAAAAATDLKRTTLELGGNDPAIVLDDADVDGIADGLFWGAFYNSGQICAAAKRIYVPEAMYEDVVEALADRARTVPVGDGAAEGTLLGPLQNQMQFDRVSELVSDAIGQGARVAAGGAARPGAGYFFEPTILADIAEGTRIVDEEQFGPAVPVMAYRDLSEAVERANATHFGLGASVWSPDDERAAAVAGELDCGTVWVNTHAGFGPHLPFAGVKWSGVGVENGQPGFESFTEVQVLYRNR